MVLDEKLTVMQVRPLYSTVYPFKPNLKLEPSHIKDKGEFIKFIKGLTTNWKDGDYFLRANAGTFAYFTLEGSRVKLQKKSRTGKEYLCWNYFAPDDVASNNGKKTVKKSVKKK